MLCKILEEEAVRQSPNSNGNYDVSLDHLILCERSAFIQGGLYALRHPEEFRVK